MSPAVISAALRAALVVLVPLLFTAACSNAYAVTFKHVVIVFQENRTPDNLFGSNPRFERGVDIATSGVNSKGKRITLGPVDLANCYDISHAHAGFEASLLQGSDQDPVRGIKGCRIPPNPQYKYVDNTSGTVQPYFDIAASYGFANRMFQTNQGPSFPAHQFIFAGTSAPGPDSHLFAAENPNGAPTGCIAPARKRVDLIDPYGSETSHAAIYPCFDHPTLTDVLEAARPPVSWRYYAPLPGSIWTAPAAIRHICQPATAKGKLTCLGPDWLNGNVVANNSAKVLTDIQKCRLQEVTWVIPTGAESDHAQINKGLGPQWVASIVNAIGQQRTCPDNDHYWDDTAILITWDDWGGWYDHVKPFKINLRSTSPKAPAAWGDGYTYGFRVPLLVVSAYTPTGYVNNDICDFGTILYFIEQNFALGFIGPGKNVYGDYADFQARHRGNLSGFFSLPSPRRFVSIAARLTPDDFINAPPTTIGPDDD